MRILISMTTVLSGLFFSDASQASIQFGQITHGGPGCKQGDEPKLGLKGRTLTLAFSNLRVSGTPDKLIDRSTCQVRLPIELESGYRLKISAPEILGSVRAPTLAEVILRSDLGLVGQDGIILSEKFSGLAKTRRVTIKEIDPIEGVYSDCGGEVVLRLNNEARLRKPEAMSSAVSGQVRSVRLQIAVERCDQ